MITINFFLWPYNLSFIFTFRTINMGEVSSLIHDAFIPINSPNCSDGEESLPTWQITDPQGLITLQLAEFAVSALNNNGKTAADSSHSLKETEESTTSVSIISPSHTHTEEERSQPLLEIVHSRFWRIDYSQGHRVCSSSSQQ